MQLLAAYKNFGAQVAYIFFNVKDNSLTDLVSKIS